MSFEDSIFDNPDPIVALARASVEFHTRTGGIYALPNDVPADLLSIRAGAFVSLHESGELRGCIGTIGATQDSLALEVIRNAVLACSEDPRFPPVSVGELDMLEYSVDVLDPPEPIDSPEDLDVLEFGVIVSKDWRRGLLLPNLEGIDTVEQQVAIAKRKAGIALDEPGVSLQRFRVVRHARGGRPRRG
ncbi:MAG: AmmeMemoRadiSam system protein A [Eggerthellaceae bacterium]|nr:AmmeMemoRadiSam system protein A [Eggerthellaceae bacterium]